MKVIGMLITITLSFTLLSCGGSEDSSNVSDTQNDTDSNISPEILFASKVDYSAVNTYDVLVYDINGDNIFDLLAPSGLGTSPFISAYLGDGSGKFVSTSNIDTPTWPYLATLGDVNNDSYFDIIYSDNSQCSIIVLINDQTNNFSIGSSFSNGSCGNSGLFLSDINYDGHLDIIAHGSNNSQLTINLNNGDGTFSPSYRPPGAIGSSLSIYDFNIDGLNDIAMYDGANSVVVLLNNGTGSFSTPQQFTTSEESTNSFSSDSTLLTGDLNGDGNIDLLTSNSSYISILYGNSAAQFPSALTIYNEGHSSFALADLNQDDIDDIVIANWNTPISILLSNEDGSHETHELSPDDSPSNAQNIVLVDLNFDQNIDLVTANAWENTISVIINITDQP
jgi:hypothetical protein